MEAATRVELDGQYRALREEAGFLERAERRLLVVRGSEAGDYLQGQLTNDVEALTDGQGCYAALLDRKGHMQSDMRVLRHEDKFLIEVEAVAHGPVFRHLDMYRIGRDAELEDIAERHAVISIIGPAASAHTGLAPLGPEHALRDETVAGASCVAVATPAGYDLLLSIDGREAVLAELERAGLVPVSEGAAEILRVEAGRPRFGREMTTATIPQEAGINERAVSFTKGCYIGQETVARLHYKGKPNRHLRGLRLASPAEAGEPVTLGERELGTVGTAVVSPRLGPLALAILRREAEPGARVAVGETGEAEVVELPF